MAEIIGYRDIPLDDLVIGKGQVRTQDPGKDVEDLARSIEVLGLLQPIVVCAAKDAEKTGKWEVLTGQRRLLAHKLLKRKSITAAILNKRVSEAEAKAISITENQVRRDLSRKELIDAVTTLYNKYGSINDVIEATGLSRKVVQAYVKFPRLLPQLQKMVKDGEVDVNVAVKAQDAATESNSDPNPEIAVKLAQEMAPMPGVQRKKLIKERKDHPEKPIDDVIESAKGPSKVVQILATVTQDTHAALQRFAKVEGTNQDEATVKLIEEALISRGLLDSEVP